MINLGSEEELMDNPGTLWCDLGFLKEHDFLRFQLATSVVGVH